MKPDDRECELALALLNIAGSCTGPKPDEYAATALAHVYGPDYRKIHPWTRTAP